MGRPDAHSHQYYLMPYTDRPSLDEDSLWCDLTQTLQQVATVRSLVLYHYYEWIHGCKSDISVGEALRREEL